MDFGKLNLTLHSGKGLRDVKNLGTMNPYAIIHIDDDSTPCIHKTNAAKKAGPDPRWEFPMTFNNVSRNNEYNLVIQIQHDGTVFDRKIGYVKIPVAVLLAGDAYGKKVRYKVKIPSGEEKGEVILSHNFTVSGEGEESDNENHTTGVKKKDRRAKTIAKKVATKIVAGVVAVGIELGISEIADEI